MTASLTQHAAMFGEALHALENGLSASRGQWNDSGRQAFDRRHGDQIVADANRAFRQLEQLARDLNAAIKALEELS